MKSIKGSTVAGITHAIQKHMTRFSACESGATTTDFVLVAAIAVSMAVGVVATTRSGATVTTEKTVAVMDAQDQLFNRLAAGQRKVAETMQSGQSSSSAGGGSQVSGGSDAYDEYNGGSVAISTPSAPQQPSTPPESNDADPQGGDQSNEQTSEAAENSETSDPFTTEQETATVTETGDPNNGDEADGPKTETEVAVVVEEEEVQPTVKPGCEDPFNKRGKIKRKCR